jgi:hypothetical protein
MALSPLGSRRLGASGVAMILVTRALRNRASQERRREIKL